MVQFFSAALLFLASAAAPPQIPIRTPIGSFPINPAKGVTHVEATRVDFAPGEEMPEHMHPVPVVCFVARGSFIVSIGREPIRQVSVGDTTIEHPGEIVHFFRNMSATEPAELYCTILAGPADRELSVMLNK